jgi:siroheme synthase
VAFASGHRSRTQELCVPDEDTVVVFMCASTLGEVARALLARARPASTPAAVIVNGTLPEQEVYLGTLLELATVQSANPGPALAVIGNVAALAPSLHWFGAPPRPLRALSAKDRPEDPIVH